MSPDLSHVRVTVIDFMGVFLPGSIWLYLLAALHQILSTSTDIGPLDAALLLFKSVAPQLGTSFYVVALIVTLITGYVAKALSIKPAERISTPRAAAYRFPYDIRHTREHYYEHIKGLVALRTRTPLDEVEKLPRGQFFHTCKRLLKMYAPALWEEAEYREAEVRMLASLFMASIFNLLLALVAWPHQGEPNAGWLSWALIATLILCLAFRVRRRREVESIYFATLAALFLIPTEEVARVVKPGA